MISSIIYTIFLCISMWGAGISIIRLFPIKYNDIIGKHLFSIGLGYAAITNTLFFLGIFNLINTISVLLVFGISLIFSFFSYQKEKPFSKIINISLNNIKASTIIILSLMCVLILMNLVGALAPPTLADSMNHHLAAPKHYASIGGFPFIPISPWSMPGLLHVLFTKVLILSNGVSCQLIIFCFGFLTTISIYAMTRKYFDTFTGLVSALIYYSLPLTTELSTGAMPEHAANFLLVISIWAILNGIGDKSSYQPGWLLFAGIIGGCSGATKLWALLGGPASVILIFYLCYLNSINLKNVFTCLILYSLAYGFVLAPWFIRNFIASGNPLWPLGYYLFETKFWNEVGVIKYSNWSRGPNSTIANYFLGPWSLTNQIEKYSAGAGAINHYLLNPLLLAFIPSLWIFWKKNDKSQKMLFYAIGFISIITYTIWFFGGYKQPRYVQIIYPFLSIITAFCAINILKIRNLFLRYISRFVIAVSFSLMIIMSAVINMKYFPVFFGTISKKEHLNNMIPHYSSIDWINNNLQDGSKILYVGGSSCWFYLNHDYLTSADKSIDYMNIKISQFKKILYDHKITHIYIEGSPENDGSTLQEINSGKVTMKDLNLNTTDDCNYWLNIDSQSLPFSLMTYHELRIFILLTAMELDNSLELVTLIKSKIIESRTRGKFKNIEDALYVLK